MGQKGQRGQRGQRGQKGTNGAKGAKGAKGGKWGKREIIEKFGEIRSHCPEIRLVQSLLPDAKASGRRVGGASLAPRRGEFVQSLLPHAKASGR